MYRILFYNEISQSTKNQEPIIWFDAFYHRNDIPHPILFNKKRMLSKESKEVILEKGQHYIELDLDRLLRIEARDHGTILFLENKTFWTTEKSIDKFELELKSNLFLRVNNNHLISLKHVKQFVKCDAMITLSNLDSIPIIGIDTDFLSTFLDGKNII